MIITGGSLNESRAAVQLAEKHSQFERFTIFLVQNRIAQTLATDLFATVGCHPTRSSEFDKFETGPEGYLSALDQLISQSIRSGRVVAVGECGLGI